MLGAIKIWMERFLEKPFYEAEIAKVDMLMRTDERRMKRLPPGMIKIKEAGS
ncbi:MAG: hypothetical protein ACOY31_03075 [Bacillota bacterium]